LTTPPAGTAAVTSWDHEVDGYLDALGRGDRQAALAQVHDLQARGSTVTELIGSLLAPAQLRIGELWASDAWSVAQEHAATAISEAVLTSLRSGSTESAPRAAGPDGPALVVTCVEQEWHALPALMVAEHLRAEGFTVSYLGANASAQGLVRHVHETGPRAVLLSCSLSPFLPLLRRQLEAVRETGTPVVVGGSAFDAAGRRARVLGATAFATSATGIAALIETLPSAVPPAPPLTHPGAEEAYAVFRDREDLAEQVGRSVAEGYGLPFPPAYAERASAATADTAVAWLGTLDDQLPHLVGTVAGALVCDDPSLVFDSLGWAEDVLLHRGAPDDCGTRLRSALHDSLRDLPVAARVLETL